MYKNVKVLFQMAYLSVSVGSHLDLDDYEPGDKKIIFCH